MKTVNDATVTLTVDGMTLIQISVWDLVLRASFLGNINGQSLHDGVRLQLDVAGERCEVEKPESWDYDDGCPF